MPSGGFFCDKLQYIYFYLLDIIIPHFRTKLDMASQFSGKSEPTKAEDLVGAPRNLTMNRVNCSVATTPLPATSLQVFAPIFQQPRHVPFVARNVWRSAVNGIRALKRLKLAVRDRAHLRSDLVVASGHTGRILLWNADSLTTLNCSSKHTNGVVTQLIVTNTKIISIVEKDQSHTKLGTDDSDIFVWDLTTMQLDTTLSGHEDRVTCIAVDSENENHILSGSNDRSILEWCLPSPIPVARYAGHTSAVSQLCFVFGKYFLSGSYDSTLQLWETDVKASPRVPVSATSRPPRQPKSMPQMLQRTPSSKALMASKVRQAQSLHVMEGHMGQISCLENMSVESYNNAHRPSSASSKVIRSEKDNATHRTVNILSACNGGLVRCYSFEFDLRGDLASSVLGSSSGTSVGFANTDFVLSTLPSMVWSNKSHKALVKDVCWDGHVVASGSLSDGLTLYNTEARVMNKIPPFGAGVRHIAIDAMRRLLVCGCEDGQLRFFSYDGFYALGQFDHYSYSAQKRSDDDSVVMVASFQPHVANITGMLLERSANGQWERLITTSSDSTFFVMDFDLQRDARVYPYKMPPNLSQSVSLQQHLNHIITPIADCGSFLLANGAGGATWDIMAMLKKGGQGKVIDGPIHSANASSSSVYDPMAASRVTTAHTPASTVPRAGAASLTLSRQSTPPPDALRPIGPSVTCCSYYQSIQRVAVGADNCTLRLHTLLVTESQQEGASPALSDGPGSPARTFANPNDHTHAGRKEETIYPPTNPPIEFEGSMAPRVLSDECVNGVVACCLERNAGPGANRSGGIALINLASERQITNVYAVSPPPISVRLFGYADETVSTVTHYIILAQLRSGQVQLLAAASNTPNITLRRVLLKDQIVYAPDREAEGTLPMPSPIYASIDVNYYPPRLDVMLVEKGILRTWIASTDPKDELVSKCALPFFEMINVTASLAGAIPVVTWAPMRLSGYLAAVALENGVVTIVSEAVENAKIPPNATPDVLREYRPIDIFVDGGVADHVLERNTRKQRRRYTKEDIGQLLGDAREPIQCTCISVSPHARLLALGYRDGTIQLWDFATKRVCRRLNGHSGRSIVHLSIFSREQRLLSISDGELRFDTLYGRNVCDTKPLAVDDESQPPPRAHA